MYMYLNRPGLVCSHRDTLALNKSVRSEHEHTLTWLSLAGRFGLQAIDK